MTPSLCKQSSTTTRVWIPPETNPLTNFNSTFGKLPHSLTVRVRARERDKLQ